MIKNLPDVKIPTVFQEYGCDIQQNLAGKLMTNRRKFTYSKELSHITGLVEGIEVLQIIKDGMCVSLKELN